MKNSELDLAEEVLSQGFVTEARVKYIREMFANISDEEAIGLYIYFRTFVRAVSAQQNTSRVFRMAQDFEEKISSMNKGVVEEIKKALEDLGEADNTTENMQKIYDSLNWFSNEV